MTRRARGRGRPSGALRENVLASGRGRGGRPRLENGRGRRRRGGRRAPARLGKAIASRQDLEGGKSTTRGPSGRTGATVRMMCPTTTAPRRRACARTILGRERTTTVPIYVQVIRARRGIEGGTSGTPARSRGSTPMAPLILTMTTGKAKGTSRVVMSERRVDEVALGRRIRTMTRRGSCDGS